MSIKEIVEMLQSINQEDEVFMITVGVSKDCIVIDFEDNRDALVISKINELTQR